MTNTALKCPQCECIFVSKSDLDQHMTTHRTTQRDYEGFEELIPIVLQRDSYTCQICQMNVLQRVSSLIIVPDAEVHHIDSDKRNNSLENLITLCPSCHRSFRARAI